jgi:hypothetical protein
MHMMRRRHLGIGIVFGAALADCVSVPSGGGWTTLLSDTCCRSTEVALQPQCSGQSFALRPGE